MLAQTPESAKPKAKKRFVSFEKKFGIVEFLRTVCHAREDGFAFYDVGWSDTSVAAKFNEHPKVIERIRIQIIGKFQQHRPVERKPGETLGSRVKRLELELETLKTQFSKLEELNKLLS